jgi:hypothetical protein
MSRFSNEHYLASRAPLFYSLAAAFLTAALGACEYTRGVSAQGRMFGDTARTDSAGPRFTVLRAGDSVAHLAAASKPLTLLRSNDTLIKPSDTATIEWPTHVPADSDAIFPEHRVVAYYGNPLSKRMGILGEIRPDSMLARLERISQEYADADPATPVAPALELVAIVAQASPGPRNLYRLRMADTLIRRVIGWADSRKYLVILDIQAGFSTMDEELPFLLPYLEHPNVHLALDPEFSMRASGKKPGTVIGSIDAKEANKVIQAVDSFVREKKLPPKFILIHRFTRNMVRNSAEIAPTSKVQIVMDMDGFGGKRLKRDSWQAYIRNFPVQYTGIKLFYKNDKPLFQPSEVIAFKPSPLFVMYQ